MNTAVRKATKKPVEIEAMQWQPGDSISAAIREWAEPAVATSSARPTTSSKLFSPVCPARVLNKAPHSSLKGEGLCAPSVGVLRFVGTLISTLNKEEP